MTTMAKSRCRASISGAVEIVRRIRERVGANFIIIYRLSILVLYLIQIALAAKVDPLPLSLYPFNGALLLTASLVLLAKVERRRGQTLPMQAPQ